jgi:hypothetical protein
MPARSGHGMDGKGALSKGCTSGDANGIPGGRFTGTRMEPGVLESVG